MTDYTEIVKKLIGRIDPIGETNADEERYVNLGIMCELVNNLVRDINEVAFYNKNRQEYSLQRAGKYAEKFLSQTLGIEH
jgi:hypothetical protein